MTTALFSALKQSFITKRAISPLPRIYIFNIRSATSAFKTDKNKEFEPKVIFTEAAVNKICIKPFNGHIPQK